MRKNMVRILAFLLVLILALGLIPVAALAATVDIYKEGYNAQYPSVDTYYNDWEDFGKESRSFSSSEIVVKISEFSNLIFVDDLIYELRGFLDEQNTDWNDEDAPLRFTSSVTLKNGDYATLGYSIHTHDYSRWYFDDTTHWRDCLGCGEKFLNHNWHCDENGDKLCDICPNAIRYYNITVVESEGGKVTADQESAPYRTRVNVTVEAEDGYALKGIRFYKVRDNGTKQQIVRYQEGTGYYFEVPTYDVEIVAEFIKK